VSVLKLIAVLLRGLLASRAALVGENLALRHQLWYTGRSIDLANDNVTTCSGFGSRGCGVAGDLSRRLAPPIYTGCVNCPKGFAFRIRSRQKSALTPTRQPSYPSISHSFHRERHQELPICSE